MQCYNKYIILERGLCMVHCPNCGSSNIKKGELLVYNLTPLKVVLNGVCVTVYAYVCLDCGLVVPAIDT